MQDLENDDPGYNRSWQITTLFASKQRVELKRAGVESSLLVDIKRKKAVTEKCAWRRYEYRSSVPAIDQDLRAFAQEYKRTTGSHVELSFFQNYKQ